jgi:hypothetical protein
VRTTDVVEYEVGDVIVYKPLGGPSFRTCRVIERHANIEDTGRAGFDAVELDPLTYEVRRDQFRRDREQHVWGYDEHIVEVVER